MCVHTGWCTPNAKILEICEKGDALMEEEIAKVYKGKKLTKGFAHPTTVSPSSYITPYTPLKSDASEAERTLKDGEIVKIQLGAQIDGFGTIVCDNFPVGGGKDGVVETYDGSLLPMRPDSILLHGDTPGAVALGKALRKLVNDAGWTVTSVSRLHE